MLVKGVRQVEQQVVEQLEARDLFLSGGAGERLNREKRVLTELEALAQAEAHISLPVMGAVLAQRVRADLHQHRVKALIQAPEHPERVAGRLLRDKRGVPLAAGAC